MKKDKHDFLISIGLFVAALLLLAAMISYTPYDISFETSTPNIHVRNYIGITGAYTAWAVFKTIGYAGFFIPLLLSIWAIGILAEKLSQKSWVRFLGMVVLFLSSATFFSLTQMGNSELMVDRGGLLGFLLGNVAFDYFGIIGGYIITVALSILAILVATEFLIVPILSLLLSRVINLINKITMKKQAVRGQAVKKADTREDLSKPRLRPAVKIEKPEPRLPIQRQEPAPIIARMDRIEKKMPRPVPAPMRMEKIEPKTVGDYKMPSLDLLSTPPPEFERMIGEDLEDAAAILEDTLRDFGIESKVIDIAKGPVITRYEVQPAPGVKVNRITALSDDIALTMKATTVRIEAPIPGKSCVGIEVPNLSTSLVYLKEILESSEYQEVARTSKLAMALGKDISGKCVVADLGDMPHLLIAGTTGSGKTVCVNSIIMSMIYNATPDELKFLMVDPKMVELAVYNGLPHLLCPVVTDGKKVPGALAWVVSEMENRYKMLAKVTARNIKSYNLKSEEKLPYIVIIIDELADLMMIAQEDIENAITRLAQLSRAVGIHLLLATQRPSVDVVTGVIKANFPARISFKVASKVDSRTVLDMNGADKLLGKGDMLFLEPGNEKPVRAQGTLLTDNEIEKVVTFIKQQRNPIYDEEILEQQKKSITAKDGIDKDEFFDDAVRMVLETGQASVSMLQRRLRLGYTRAARLIDAMEAEGIVGPFRGSKPREILAQDYQTVKDDGQPADAEGAGQEAPLVEEKESPPQPA